MAELADTRATLTVTESTPGPVVVRMAGEYDIASVEPLEAHLDALLRQDTESVVIDMSELRFMDTSGVALLIRIANNFGSLEIRNASALICRTIQALGLSERLGMQRG